tara:strand:+ start:9085 stop:9297 length:213 start_codon:yes stop_codon:yes gene_type:complete
MACTPVSLAVDVLAIFSCLALGIVMANTIGCYEGLEREKRGFQILLSRKKGINPYPLRDRTHPIVSDRVF